MAEAGLGQLVANYLRSVRPGRLVSLVAETYLGALVRGLPGPEGFLLLYKALFRRLGGLCYVYPGARISHAYGIAAGRHLSLNSGGFLYGRGGLTIGDHMMIGPNAVVLPGVRIADGTVVSAGAVVNRDTELYAIVGGPPAARIGERPRLVTT